MGDPSLTLGMTREQTLGMTRELIWHGPGPIPRQRKKSFIDVNGTPLAIRENTPLSRISVAAS